MAIMTDSTKILEKLEEYEEEGGYNMCLAVDKDLEEIQSIIKKGQLIPT